MQLSCISLNYMNAPLLETLKKQGARLTPARRLLLDIFTKHPEPLSELEIRQKLKSQGLVVNKTTTYRALTHLKQSGIVNEIELGDGKKRYELSNQPHHHHLVCQKCKTIHDIQLDNDLKQIEQKIKKQKGFINLSHTLEFFGLCQICAKDY